MARLSKEGGQEKGRANLGKAKVCQLDMTKAIQKNILWLHISVDDVMRMQMIQCHS
jgi:hypothetical protein